MNNQRTGLKQQIQRAETAAEIETLLSKGATFTDASPQTKRLWVNAAARRRYELANDVRA